MQTRKDSLSVLKVCRFCLSQDGSLTSLYAKPKEQKNTVTLALKILSCIAVEVFPSDKRPSFICDRCKVFMELFYEFKQICRKSDENILHYVQSGTALESIVWHPLLVKVFRYAAKESNQIENVKTIVEGDATLEMTLQEETDSEEDDEEEENVYNIKIGDGSHGDLKSRTACIKVVTNRDELDITKKSEKPGKVLNGTELKGENSKHCAYNTNGEREDNEVVQSGCFPCGSCDRTFPLKQLLELHQKQHRVREVPCGQCDAKFFSKADLYTHQLRHSDEMPFQCVACGKKFKRLILLKRHEKLIHSDLPQLRCAHCPCTFLSEEELEAHQKRHIRVMEQRFNCHLCDKKFHAKATLQRHKNVVHGESLPFVCQYCPQRFSAVSKLTRHVRTHAGERAFPCKYCKKSFVKSHHYTRHLRLKHRETVTHSRGPFGETEEYRCEQCDDIFTTQDELVYHSAIHATQNLTCPLCQEKFENVDAVTAHVKSHVHGMEFTCELCELLFTSQEKLDNHMNVAHEDEIANDQDMGSDEPSMEVDGEGDDEINVKEEEDHMLVEIKKAGDYIMQGVTAEKVNINLSEDSEPEMTYTSISGMDVSVIKKDLPAKDEKKTLTDTKSDEKDKQTVSILRKAEEIKRKVKQQTESDRIAKKMKNDNNIGGASDKSLRLLEKELQDLKRTNTRNADAPKSTPKPVDAYSARARRPLNVTKLRSADEKKTQTPNKSAAGDKKVPERRALTKENKEPKDNKEVKQKDEKEKETKEKEAQKVSAIKNGTNDKTGSDESVRRSSRPSKIKDYAKMIRKGSHEEGEDSYDDSDYEKDEEYMEGEDEISPESRPKARRSSIIKTTPKTQPPPMPAARKRGRPRKDQHKSVATKVTKRVDVREPTPTAAVERSASDLSEASTSSKTSISENKLHSGGVLVSPTGQTLTKVSMKCLPPGVRPLPLSISARPIITSELCEMQIGEKVMRVQKIVMTKAEVDAMAEKGLVEMKDGTMLLKRGIKLPTADPAGVKPTLVGEANKKKELPVNTEKVGPTGPELQGELM